MSLRKFLTKEFLWLVLVQYVGFKISWAATAWGAVEGPPYSYYGSLSFFAFIALHLWYNGKKWELKFTLAMAAFGTVVDSIYNITGLIDYNGTYPYLDFLAPIWITSIWAGLAVTLDYSLEMLVGRPWLIFITGAIFGPLAHWSGEAMGALRFGLELEPSLAILAVPWGLALVFCYWLMERYRPPGEKKKRGTEEPEMEPELETTAPQPEHSNI